MTTEFPNTVTRGFSAVGQPNVAVCLLPGTELAFSEEVACDYPFAKLFPQMRFGNLGERLARFRQVDYEPGTKHHDGLEFANGKVVLLDPAPSRPKSDGAAASGPAKR